MFWIASFLSESPWVGPEWWKGRDNLITNSFNKHGPINSSWFCFTLRSFIPDAAYSSYLGLLITNYPTYLYSYLLTCMCLPTDKSPCLWGGSKGIINFPRIFYAMRNLVPIGHFRNISEHLFTRLVCGSFRWCHGLLFTDCIEWDDKDKVIGFKRSHSIHLGWWSTGSPKFQLFQLSQYSHVTNCRMISS